MGVPFLENEVLNPGRRSTVPPPRPTGRRRIDFPRGGGGRNPRVHIP